MFFKSLIIQGFKSFPDKTELHFDGKMTAIVGSNGNGKSNISDALRWVMGEQGAKSLRGDKMEDVIFHGTMTRKQMNFALVSLIIDNTDRRLGMASNEVTITRKLFRTGESEYLINDSKVRLRDIQELLMGTGLSRDGYSIIGQGRVAEVVSARDKERRLIFEEAAGVSKFLHQKVEAEQKLARATDNILRLSDIAKTLSDRLPTLKKQSEKAFLARSLLEEEKTLEVSVSVSEIDSINKGLTKTLDMILENEGQCEQYDREIGELTATYEATIEQKQTLRGTIEKQRNSGAEAKDKMVALEKEKAVIENEILHNSKQIIALTEKVNSTKTVTELQERLASFKDERTKTSCKKTELAIEIAEQSTVLTTFDNENKEADIKLLELNEKQRSLFSTESRANIMIAEAENRLIALQKQITANKEKVAAQDVYRSQYEAKKVALESEIKATNNLLLELHNQITGYQMKATGADKKISDLNDSYRQKKELFQKTKGELDIYKSVEKGMVGYFSGVKAVMTASSGGRLSSVLGTVADVISVPKMYNVAIETALGGGLQDVIVQNEETAKQCIRFLKESNAGRVTFLPLTSIKGYTINTNGLEKYMGYCGLASEIVSFDGLYKDIVTSLLGKTVIATDIDTGTVIARNNGYKFKVVTLDGQVINAGGSFTGGSATKSSGIISRKSEIAALEERLPSLQNSVAEIERVLTQLMEEKKKSDLELIGFKEQEQQSTLTDTRLKTELSGLINLNRQFELQVKEALEAFESLQKEIDEKTAEKEKYSEILQKNAAEIEINNKQLIEMGSTVTEIADKRKSVNDTIVSQNLAVITAEKEIENLNYRIAELERQMVEEATSKEQLKAEIEALQAETARFMEKKAIAADSIATVSRGTDDLEAAIATLINEQNMLEQTINLTAKAIREKTEQKGNYSNALVLAKERKENSEKEVAKLTLALWNKYEMPLSEARQNAKDVPDVRIAKNRLVELNKQVSALGNINFAAIEEYTSVSTEFKTMESQLTDLDKAKTDLEALIDKLIADIKTQFLDSFNAINGYFSEIFKEIFEGGSAHLELSDPDNLLETGIEIYAAPPGKLMKSLSLLSGGEQTMVAITIYFAILKHRPSPFCMLDEVDAALDEINVVKYVNYLKRFSIETQLMIITHRRGTIEGCDVLYGVYMQEKGISKLLRQDIIDEEMETT